MGHNRTFQDVAVEDLLDLATKLDKDGWRAVQVLCTSTDNGIDLTYSFARDEDLANYQVRGVTKDTQVPSLQGMFLGLFPFENEAKDLFGVNITGMVLDFAGEFYQTSMSEPMTILSPEAKARKDKAAKAAAAKAAKESKEPKDGAGGALTEEEIEAKVAGLPPEKAEKLRTALRAKAQKAGKPAEKPAPKAMTEEEIEAKVAGLPPEKAEKLRAALLAKAKQASEEQQA